MTRIGIVGCGFVSTLYMESLPRYDDLTLVGAYDINMPRRDRFCEHFKTRPYPSLESLTADVDLIVNLTTPEEHHGVSSYVLSNGKPVYTEKPMTTTPAESRSLIELAVANNTNILGAPCGHLSEMAQTVAHYLAEEKIGKVYAVYAEMDDGLLTQMPYEKWQNELGVLWPAKNEFESGSTLEHAGYLLCLLQSWFGTAEIKSVAQHICIPDKTIPLHKQTADFSCAILEYPDNIIARVTCSIVAKKDRQIKIFGETGVLTIGDVWKYDAPVKWQNMITIRRKTMINPLKRTLKAVNTSYPKAPKTSNAQMDFCRGIHQLAQLTGPDHEKMAALLNVNEVVLEMNGESTIREQHPWIILGTGNMATNMGDCLRRNGYLVKGVFSVQADRAQTLVDRFNAEDCYAALDEIPVATQKTIAYVASVNDKHYEQVRTLLEKGYDVLCEKPLTMQLSQTEELYQLATEKNLQLQENLWSLFVPSAPAIKEDAAQHDSIELAFYSPIPYAPDSRQWQPEAGGSLYDLGIYPLAWAVHFFGEIKSYTVDNHKVEHDIVSELELTTTHENGKTAKIKTGFSTTSQYIKLGDYYYTPIYAPEFKSKVGHNLVRKVREKLIAPNYPAKDPYAYILDQLNTGNADHAYPPKVSLHIAKLMQEIHEATAPSASIPSNTSPAASANS